MSPDTSTPVAATTDSVVADATIPHTLQAGLELVLKAEDSGDWKPVIDWLARHPGCATELAEFLAAQRGIQPLIAPLRASKSPPGLVGGLELRGELGKGAMGVVYRAYDPALKCERAVKLLRTTGDVTADELVKFRIEAEDVASLGDTNEHIVPVLAYGETDGVPYLVMPLMKQSLAAWLKQRKDEKLTPKRAAEIARDIALGVHHAHQRGLIHRDLKPGNILLDDQGRPRVADFGLARRVDATMTGGVAGTPSYMAPEQTRAGTLTTAVDVHAVGVILFELLAGGPPFGGKESDVGSILRKVADERVPGVRQWRKDVPRDLEAICTRCLEKEPEDRYPSAAALAEDLQRFLNGEPISGRRGKVVEFTRLFVHNRTEVPITNHLGHLIGALATFVLMAIATAGAVTDRPQWAFAALLVEMPLWGVLFGLFIWMRAGQLNSIERASGEIKFWAMTTLACLLPFALVAPDPLWAFIPVTAVTGLCVLSHGPVHGGREFLGGMALLIATVVMPFLPTWTWPIAHGLSWGGWALWYALRMRSHHHSVQIDAHHG